MNCKFAQATKKELYKILEAESQHFYFDDSEVELYNELRINFRHDNINYILETFGTRNFIITERILRYIVFNNPTNYFLRSIINYNDIVMIRIVMKTLALKEKRRFADNFFTLLTERYFDTKEEYNILEMIIFNENVRETLILE